MTDWAVVKVFESQAEANLAKTILDDAGIDAIIEGDDAGGMLKNFTVTSGLRLLVPPHEEERARGILGTEDDGDEDDPDEEDEEDEG